MYYNNTERKVRKQQDMTVFLLFGAFTISYIFEMLVASSTSIMGFIAALFLMIAFVESMIGLLFYTFLYLQAMKWYQNYEYKKHKRTVILQSISLVLSLGLLVIIGYVGSA